MKKYNFQHSKSWKKPSSETHNWSFKRTCDSAQAQIENKWGIDYRLISISFKDLGRTTKTRSTWDGKRTWKCTHKIIATYEIEHRGNIDIRNDKYLTDQVNLQYQALNEFHEDFDKESITEEEIEENEN